MNSVAPLDARAEYQTLVAIHQLFTVLSGGTSRILNDLATELNKIAVIETTVTAEQSQATINSLTRIRQGLSLFDQHLPAANLRRHFEQYGTMGNERLEWVLRFYLGKQIKTTADRDKVDLIVTRWGQTQEQLLDDEASQFGTTDLTNRLNDIYQQLGLIFEDAVGEAAAIARLVQERQSLLGIKSLRELIDRQVLLRVRKIKDEMEELFFRPAILAEVVEVNLSLQNVFQQLLRAEQNQQLNECESVAAQLAPTDNCESTLNNEVEQLAVSIIEAGDQLAEAIGLDSGLSTQAAEELALPISSVKSVATTNNQDVVVALTQIGQTLAELALQVQGLVLRLTKERSKP